MPFPSVSMLWIAAAAAASANGPCDSSGPRLDQAAWSATVSDRQPRAYFLKSHDDDARCPAEREECRKKSYLVPGDSVLAWARDGAVLCALYTSPDGRSTSAWLAAAALDLRGDPATLRVDDWVGHWQRDSDADLTIRRLDSHRVEVSGSATWGGDDPSRVENGSVHTGEIDTTVVAITGWKVRFVAGAGNAPPAPVRAGDCMVELQWLGGALRVQDNGGCGGMNVRFDGNYQRLAH
jgi:hypothetical protein